MSDQPTTQASPDGTFLFPPTVRRFEDLLHFYLHVDVPDYASLHVMSLSNENAREIANSRISLWDREHPFPRDGAYVAQHRAERQRVYDSTLSQIQTCNIGDVRALARLFQIERVSPSVLISEESQKARLKKFILPVSQIESTIPDLHRHFIGSRLVRFDQAFEEHMRPTSPSIDPELIARLLTSIDNSLSSISSAVHRSGGIF